MKLKIFNLKSRKNYIMPFLRCSVHISSKVHHNIYYSSIIGEHYHKIAGISSSDHGQTAKPFGVSTDKPAQLKILLIEKLVMNLNTQFSMYRL
jgi:hypothetical protein